MLYVPLHFRAFLLYLKYNERGRVENLTCVPAVWGAQWFLTFAGVGPKPSVAAETGPYLGGNCCLSLLGHRWVHMHERPSVGLSESLASNPAQGGLHRHRLGVTPDAYTRRTTVSLVGLCESRASSPCFRPEELEIKEGTTGKETMEKPTKALCHLPTFHWKLGRAKL